MTRDPGMPPAGESGSAPILEQTEIADNPAERRYEAHVGGRLAGIVEYGRIEGRLVALHTEVFPEFGGRGIGSALVRRVLADARDAGVKVTPRCPFFVAHFERHAEDHDLLAHPLRPRDASKRTR